MRDVGTVCQVFPRELNGTGINSQTKKNCLYTYTKITYPRTCDGASLTGGGVGEWRNHWPGRIPKQPPTTIINCCRGTNWKNLDTIWILNAPPWHVLFFFIGSFSIQLQIVFRRGHPKSLSGVRKHILSFILGKRNFLTEESWHDDFWFCDCTFLGWDERLWIFRGAMHVRCTSTLLFFGDETRDESDETGKLWWLVGVLWVGGCYKKTELRRDKWISRNEIWIVMWRNVDEL